MILTFQFLIIFNFFHESSVSAITIKHEKNVLYLLDVSSSAASFMRAFYFNMKL